MGFADLYLDKHSLFKPFIAPGPEPGTSMIVIIPSYSEPDVLTSLKSLYIADRPSFPVEVIVVVNAPENAGEFFLQENRKTVSQVKQWIDRYDSPGFRVHVIDTPPFPKKHAGAGFARKTGMDEAVHRFNLLNNQMGIIVSFDADSICDSNYLTGLEKCFSDQDVKGCTIYFEHPLEGVEEPPDVYNAVTEYELYLRYFVQAMRVTGFPWAFHTIGSCFAVNAKVYASQGGMNRKTAGEDFYFLHKVFPLGGFTELNTTRVIPSSRVSGRVPFGTGAAIKKYVTGAMSPMTTYPPGSFDELKFLFDTLPEFYNIGEEDVARIVKKFPRCTKMYLELNNFALAVQQMNNHTAGFPSFRKRFFTWFNAFRIIRFLNFARKECYPDKPLTDVARELLESLEAVNGESEQNLLLSYRKLQRNTVWKC